jgi:predicted GNAT superfamily acetyltransferase
MSTPSLREYAPADAEAVLALNRANVPQVGPLDGPKLELFAREAAWFPVAYAGDELVGFAIFLTEGADYASPNYRWFGERHDRFLYVDRIAIAERARGAGLGQRLYGEAVERARAGDRPVFCAEVNTVPPNPSSMRFHERFGFREVARERPYDPESEVAMLVRDVGQR